MRPLFREKFPGNPHPVCIIISPYKDSIKQKNYYFISRNSWNFILSTIKFVLGGIHISILTAAKKIHLLCWQSPIVRMGQVWKSASENLKITTSFGSTPCVFDTIFSMQYMNFKLKMETQNPRAYIKNETDIRTAQSPSNQSHKSWSAAKFSFLF